MTEKLPAPRVPVSWGEALDKLTILEIKRDRIKGDAAQANILAELSALEAVVAPLAKEIGALKAALKSINEKLWDIEDAIRDKERLGAFDAEFIALARAVY